jgi:tetratricopeptide (TPR) repeat protein
MGTTRRELAVSTDSVTAIDALDAFTDRLAGIRLGVEEVLTATDTEPEVASLQLAAAMLFLYGQTAATTASAATFLDAARASAPTMNERERATLAALERWHADDYLAAAVRWEQIVAAWPRDLLALKALEFTYYVLGQQHMGQRFLTQVEAVADANRGDADFLAAWAFAAELSGAPDRAEELAEESISIEPHTPWAHHALAHAYITRGDPLEAVARLESFLPVWQTSGQFIHAHNAWHLAVALLDRLAFDRAQAVYDAHIWGFLPDTPGEQIDAISYLWRLEMIGEQVDDARWSAVADHVEARAGECFFPFLSAHHAYALARAGRDEALATLLASVEQRTSSGTAESVRVWQPTGRAVVAAAAAHGRGDLAQAATLLDPVAVRITEIGGSDAQDDLFRLAYFTALVGAGRGSDGARYFDTVTAFKTRSPLDERLRATAGT